MKKSVLSQGKKSHSAALLFAACAAVASPSFTHAATPVWDGGAGADSAYLADTNWNPDLSTGTGPGTTDTAQFDLAGTAATIDIDFGATTNNGAGNEAIGQILLNAGISRTINNSSATTPGILTLNGAGGVVLANNSSASTLTLADGTTQTMGVALATTGDVAVLSGASVIINSIVSDGGSGFGFTKSGQGTFALNGLNTYTGGVSVNAGTLSVNTLANTGTAQSLGTGPASLNLGSAGSFGVLLYTGAATTTNRNIVIGNAGGIVSTTNTLTFSGIVSGSGSFTKTGGGNLLLVNSANSYTAGTVISGGTLTINGDTRLGTAPTTVVASQITINAGTLSGSTGFTISTNRGILLGSASSTIDVAANSVVSFTGVVIGTGTLNKTGAGALDLRLASNTYSGGTVVKNGRVDITQDRDLGVVPTGVQAANVTLDGSTLRFYSNAAGGITLDANRGVTLTAAGGTIDWSQSSGTPTVQYPITSPAGSVLTKLGSRTVLGNVAQPNLNGDFNINAGRFNAQISGALGNGTIRLQAQPADIAQLGIGGTNLGLTVTLNNPIVLNPNGGTNSFDVNNSTPTQNNLILTGNITGTGSLIKGVVAGTSGILTLSGTNTYTGATNVKIGTLRISGGNAIPDTSAVTLDSFTVNSVPVALDLQGSNETIGGLSGGGAADGNVLLGAGTLTVLQNTPSTYAGTISGVGGSFVKDGTDTLTVTNSNNSYSGNTIIKAGTLSVPGSNQLGSSTNDVFFDGGTLLATGAINSGTRNVSLGVGGATINTNGNAVTFANVAGLGNLTKSGGGTLTVNRIRGGNVSLTGGTTAIPANGNVNGVSKIKTLNISSALLDLSDNHLITTSPAGSWNGSAYTDITGLVASGKGSGNTWNGASGIITTQTAAVGSNYTSIGVASASDVRPNTATETALWAGQTITGTDTLVMYTYGGDATLDGKINIDDYVKIDSGIAGGYTGWSNGDFNYDGKVSIDDYITVIDANIGNQTGIFFSAGGVDGTGGLSGVSAVPEPGAGGLILISAAMMARRRSRRMVTELTHG